MSPKQLLPQSQTGHTHSDKTRFIQIEFRHIEEGVATDLVNYDCISVVPGGGFEPPTRGFSVHCSTPELPGQGKARCFGCDSTRASRLYCPEGF